MVLKSPLKPDGSIPKRCNWCSKRIPYVPSLAVLEADRLLHVPNAEYLAHYLNQPLELLVPAPEEHPEEQPEENPEEQSENPEEQPEDPEEQTWGLKRRRGDGAVGAEEAPNGVQHPEEAPNVFQHPDADHVVPDVLQQPEVVQLPPIDPWTDKDVVRAAHTLWAISKGSKIFDDE